MEQKHSEGSRKSKVHAAWDKDGPDAAWKLGLKLELAEATLRSWFGYWRRASEGPAKVVKGSKGSPPQATPAKEVKATKPKAKKPAKAATEAPEAGEAMEATA